MFGSPGGSGRSARPGVPDVAGEHIRGRRALIFHPVGCEVTRYTAQGGHLAENIPFRVVRAGGRRGSAFFCFTVAPESTVFYCILHRKENRCPQKRLSFPTELTSRTLM